MSSARIAKTKANKYPKKLQKKMKKNKRSAKSTNPIFLSQKNKIKMN